MKGVTVGEKLQVETLWQNAPNLDSGSDIGYNSTLLVKPSPWLPKDSTESYNNVIVLFASPFHLRLSQLRHVQMKQLSQSPTGH